MAEPTLLGDVIQPEWQSLTPEQRTCWHFWALANPQQDEQGRLTTLYGQQAHYARNADIATAVTVPLLTEPPPDTTPPAKVAIVTFAWPIQSQLTMTTTARNGYAWAETSKPLPADTLIIVKQGYDRKKTGKGRPPRVRHITVLIPLDAGKIDLRAPTGYFASTAGENRYSRIKGVTAKRRPDLPLGTVRIVNVTNGETIREILKNPNGGARKKNNRARATQHRPLDGTNHYP